MKESRITVIAVGLVILVLVAYLFVFQVRITEVAVHYRAGEVQKVINADPTVKDQSGWYFRIPWFDRFVKFDRRTRVLDGKLVETQLQDDWQVIISMYAAWRVSDPVALTARLQAGNDPPDKTMKKAEGVIKEIIQNETSKVVGKRRFKEFVNTDKEELEFDEITREITAGVREALEGEAYGLTLAAFGIRQIAIPEATTAEVFLRMNAERDTVAGQYRSEGRAEKRKIIAEAQREASETLAKAEAEAIETRRAGEEEEAASYVKFAKAPELAIYLQRLETARAISRQARQSGSPITFLLGEKAEPWSLLFEGPEGRAEGTNLGTQAERREADYHADSAAAAELATFLQGPEAPSGTAERESDLSARPANGPELARIMQWVGTLRRIAEQAKESGSPITLVLDPETGSLTIVPEGAEGKEED